MHFCRKSGDIQSLAFCLFVKQAADFLIQLLVNLFIGTVEAGLQSGTIVHYENHYVAIDAHLALWSGIAESPSATIRLIVDNR